MRLNLSEIVKACGGILLSGEENTVITGFSTDSRTVKKGMMFVPIQGARTDGHKYLPEVFAAGAAAAFTQKEPEQPDAAQPLVLVEDTVKALQQAAALYRDRFTLPVVGITGSAGKTTTKEMIALALSARKKVMRTEGNQNSQVGVAQTVCRLRKEQEAAVVELGVSLPGEMARIAAVAKPTIAVITNIGVSHIEFLKSRENILAEKLHIADTLSRDGILYVCGDDDLLSGLRHKDLPYQVVTYGLSGDCMYRATEIRQSGSGTFFNFIHQRTQAEVYVPAVGAHNIRNALVALAVALQLEVPLADAIRAIGTYKPPAMRQRILKAGDITLIDDTYNANPDSMQAALELLAGQPAKGRRVAVLGDMKELGEQTETAHLMVGKFAKGKQVDLLVGLGGHAKKICEGYGEGAARHFDDKEAALAFLKEQLHPGDLVLVKGSRGMGMETLIAALQDWKQA